MKKKITAIILSLMMLLSLLPATAQDSGEAFAKQYARDLMAGDKNAQLYAQFTETVKKQLPQEAFGAVWGQIQAAFGNFVDFGSFRETEDSGYKVYEQLLDMENQDVVLRLVLDGDGLVAGLNFTMPPVEAPAAQEAPEVPDGVMEEEILIGEGEWALPGTLTLPKEGNALPAVVLVHGSGPNDRDETVGQTKLFRDMAFALAQKGIASLRYEKRTRAHANAFTPEMVASFTVREETVFDAVLAGEALAKDSRINNRRIFVAGHSLGAMLGPWIAQEAGDVFAGMILINGSPLPLTDIVISQNEVVLAQLTEEMRATQQPLLDAELEKLKALPAMPEEEAKAITVFGMPGYYVQDLLRYDGAAVLKELKKPTLILQGGKDFQVSLANGWEAWEKAAGGEAYVEMKLYPELNHVLMAYTGDPAYQFTLQEYDTPAKLDDTAAADMASWIAAH